MNEVSVNRARTKVMTVSVPQGYSGYTMTFTVNDNEYRDASPVFCISGITITNQLATVSISATQNDIEEGVYFYQADIQKGALKYNIASSSYNVLPTII